MVMNYRSSAGYTPLDFAFVVAGSKGKGVVEMLDGDHQLLPRGTDPPLKKEIIEVWKKQQQQQQPNKKKKKQKMLDPGIPLCCQFHLSENFYNINSFLCEYMPPITCLT